MKLKKISKIKSGQDGAIFGETLFRFDGKGNCTVYNMKDILSAEEPAPIAVFALDRIDEICPHSNAVMFGSEYYSPDDEFPLLYTNIYNTYSKFDNKRKGICCIYRILRRDGIFESKLSGLIEIGFCENTKLWASEGLTDVRPYGNFVIDKEAGKYYAFTMIDAPHITRYFSFNLPKLSHGVYDSEFGVNKIVLREADIIESFDTEYHNFIQGAVLSGGLIYSLEGFGTYSDKIPHLRIIDVNKKCEIERLDFAEHGVDTEPEFIDFYKNQCIYSDGHGDVYIIE